jgi:hypothetical protein
MRSGGEDEKDVQREITRLVLLSCEAHTPTLPQESAEPSERPDTQGEVSYYLWCRQGHFSGLLKA